MKLKKPFRNLLVLVLTACMAASMAACTASAQTNPPSTTTAAGNYADKITIVWYPNESAADYQGAREAFGQYITQATGKEVSHKLTTDYSIAIEAIASGTAQISFMGAQGYIEAKNKSDAVRPLFVNSGVSGTLDDAIYFSWFAVNKGQESNYGSDGGYSIENIQGKRMSFVSNSSTSGFKIPTNAILSLFTQKDQWKNMTVDDLIEGSSDHFFAEVLFGGSHQGSAVNLLTDKADVAAFCDTEMAPYMNLSSGEENKAGAVYEVKAGAAAPFDTLVGKQIFIIKSTPVLNGPFAYNANTLSPDDAGKIQTLFTSDVVSNDEKIFVKKDSGLVGMFKKTDKECFLLVEDAWFNPIREMK